MHIAILHYHLSHGGVVQVIANHLLALDSAIPARKRARVAVLFGDRRQGWPSDLDDRLRSIDVTLRQIPPLEYDQSCSPRPGDLARQVTAALESEGFSPTETVIHIHNHGLGKNVSLPGAVAGLAERGFGILLHIHDFAEDYRPANYRRLTEALAPTNSSELPAILYPQAQRIHYAVLNTRDYGVLRDAGIPEGRLHLLPNPVPDFGRLPDVRDSKQLLFERFGIPLDRRYLLYPVRGIRRKNLGEALLWSLLMEGKAEVGISLAVENPLEQPIYRSWKSLASGLELPMSFETGIDGLSLLENFSAADQILTTSLAEGFGMVFLESWLAARPLVGRDLPEITRDFTAAGLVLDSLRPSLCVPLDQVRAVGLREKLEQRYRKVRAEYGLPALESSKQHEFLEARTEDGLVDFGDLDEEYQKIVIEAANRDAGLRTEIRQSNPGLFESIVEDPIPSERIEENARVVRKHFGPKPIGERLWRIYDEVLASSGVGEILPLSEGHRVLDRFLDPGRFRLIRS